MAVNKYGSKDKKKPAVGVKVGKDLPKKKR